MFACPREEDDHDCGGSVRRAVEGTPFRDRSDLPPQPLHEGDHVTASEVLLRKVILPPQIDDALFLSCGTTTAATSAALRGSEAELGVGFLYLNDYARSLAVRPPTIHLVRDPTFGRIIERYRWRVTDLNCRHVASAVYATDHDDPTSRSLALTGRKEEHEHVVGTLKNIDRAFDLSSIAVGECVHAAEETASAKQLIRIWGVQRQKFGPFQR